MEKRRVGDRQGMKEQPKGFSLDFLSDYYDLVTPAEKSRFRRRQIGLMDIHQGEKVLEVGCGTGALSILSKIAVRLGFGFVLITYASQSKVPLTLQIIGAILLASGVVLAVISRDRFGRLVAWSLDRFSKYIRLAALASLLLGVFLIHAVV